MDQLFDAGEDMQFDLTDSNDEPVNSSEQSNRNSSEAVQHSSKSFVNSKYYHIPEFIELPNHTHFKHDPHHTLIKFSPLSGSHFPSNSSLLDSTSSQINQVEVDQIPPSPSHSIQNARPISTSLLNKSSDQSTLPRLDLSNMNQSTSQSKLNSNHFISPGINLINSNQSNLPQIISSQNRLLSSRSGSISPRITIKNVLNPISPKPDSLDNQNSLDNRNSHNNNSSISPTFPKQRNGDDLSFDHSNDEISPRPNSAFTPSRNRYFLPKLVNISNSPITERKIHNSKFYNFKKPSSGEIGRLIERTSRISFKMPNVTFE
jgi:hypothetical protein